MKIEAEPEDMVHIIHAYKELQTIPIGDIPSPWDFKFPIATCPTCGSNHVQKWGFRHGKSGVAIQRLKCMSCRHRWEINPHPSFMAMRTNPNVITTALELRSRGMSLRAIQNHIAKVEHVDISHVAVFKWIQKYRGRCPIVVGKSRPIVLLSIPEDVAQRIKALPIGFAQETTLSANGARTLLSKLTQTGFIGPNAYRVATRRKDDKIAVFIVHETGS